MTLIAGLSADRIAFYATVATVLPIIMIAFALQLRAHAIILGSAGTLSLENRVMVSLRIKKRLLWMVVVLALVVTASMGGAEIFALQSLADGKSYDFLFVKGTVVVAAVVLTLGIIDAVTQQVLGWAKEWLAGSEPPVGGPGAATSESAGSRDREQA